MRCRTTLLCLLAGAAFISLLAALPGNPAGPLDARTRTPAPGFRLEFPVDGAVIEPFAAPTHALAGAPDHLTAVFSTLAWVALLGFLVMLVRALRRGESAWLAGAKALGAALGGAVLFSSYVLFCLLVHLPGWRLVADSDDYLLADLQTHTFASHDGILTARRNLAKHAAVGCDVVAVTEHDDTKGSMAAAGLAEAEPSLPAVLPGLELREWGGGYLLGFGGRVSRREIDPLDLRSAERFVARMRGSGGGVLALPWKLSEQDVARLADAGIDGFEIANFGHPRIREGVRQAILREARDRGLVLVASSDWHGWGGFWRTWTAIKVRGWRRMGKRARAQAVLEALVERRAADFVPLTAGVLGPAAPLRVVFAPFVETVRYGRELSPARVVAWWIWIGLLLGVWELLRLWGFRPGWVLLALLLAVLGGGLAAQGGVLLAAWAGGQTASAFPARIGAWALGLGVALALAAAWSARRELLERSRG